MYKREFKLQTQYKNNFYDGSIYDLVFLDLEWCRDFHKDEFVQKIFGYTITHILKSSDEQYIKIQFIESSSQEKKLIQDILNDLQNLQDKYFVGYGLSTSDMYCLHQRIEALDLIPKVESIRILDLQRISQRQNLNQGLNNLFAYLGIPICKRIKGYYVFQNGIKVLRKEKGYETILNEIYEYCLEDAENYFYIISNWQTQFPLIDCNKHLTIDLKIDPRSERRIRSRQGGVLQRPS